MSRKQAFKEAVIKPITIKDSRFGLRKLFLNEQEKPTIATYDTLGRGQNGESQN